MKPEPSFPQTLDCMAIYLYETETQTRYIVRKQAIHMSRPYQPKVSPVGVVAKGLAEARKIASRGGRENMGRAAADDPLIVEIWV